MSWLSRFSPVPSFPPLPGPYEVGTVDVEIAASDLPSPSPAPENAPATVAYRIFYPCEKPTTATRPVRWIPNPQRANLAGLISYIGVRSRVADIVSYFTPLIYRISVPAHRSSPLLPRPSHTSTEQPPPPSPPAQPHRYPVTLFSHGLAGTRNLYSHFCASLASHGAVVIALDHRDGSSPLQHIRATPSTPAATVHSVSIPYGETGEAFAARDAQLRIRAWEVALVYRSLLEVDAGREVRNLDPNLDGHGAQMEVLGRFRDRLDLREGRVAWAGHSFGAATVVQVLKCCWRVKGRGGAAADGGKGEGVGSEGQLFVPDGESEIVRQVTRDSPVALLDPWMMPLLSPMQKALWETPLPLFDGAVGQDGTGVNQAREDMSGCGSNVIAIVSEGFYKWKQNLMRVVQLLTPPDGSTATPGQAWYATGSKHFSQSDFGVLFSWIMERVMKAGDGRALMEGNVALVNGMLRHAGWDLAPGKDLENVVGEGMTTDDGDKRPGDSSIEAKQEQVEQPVSQAMPNILDEKIWIRIPVGKQEARL